MDWITLDSVIFAPVILYLENWINIEMERTQGGGRPRYYQHQMEGLLIIMMRIICIKIFRFRSREHRSDDLIIL